MSPDLTHCPNCGGELHNEATVCSQCGAPIRHEDFIPSTDPASGSTPVPNPVPPGTAFQAGPSSPPAAGYRAAPAPKARKTWLWVIIIILALCMICACAGAAVFALAPDDLFTKLPFLNQNSTPVGSLQETPSEAPTMTSQETPIVIPGFLIEKENVRFLIPDPLGNHADFELIPANMDENEYWRIPQTWNFKLANYPHTSSVFEPSISIYRIEDYKAINPHCEKEINLLQALLSSQNIPDSGYLPFLPVANAAQVFHSNAAFMRFRNGNGIRYITFMAQDICEITNDYLFFTYQGISDDGKYYVSVRMPVAHPDLQDHSQLNAAQYDELTKNYENYLSGVQHMLETVPQSEFTPRLNLLDSLISSIEVNIP